MRNISKGKKFKIPKQRRCFFVKNKIRYIDYKDVETLKKFTYPNGRIISSYKTKTKHKNQVILSRAIKRAREMALLPFVKF